RRRSCAAAPCASRAPSLCLLVLRPVLGPQRHRVDHQDGTVLQLHRHDLKRPALGVIAQEDKALARASRRALWRRGGEDEPAVFDDMGDPLSAYAMPARAAPPPDLHPAILSDRIARKFTVQRASRRLGSHWT